MIFALVSFSTLLPAQKFTLNGYVKDKELSESLIGADIFQPKTPAGFIALHYRPSQ